jgi:hypothetical protein
MTSQKPSIHDPDFPTPEDRHLSPAYLTSIVCCVIVTIACVFFTVSIGLIGWFSVEALKATQHTQHTASGIGVVTFLASIITGCTCSTVACYALDVFREKK